MVSQHRGQAFETMMLVISVIIAVAILGILTGFLGGISLGSTGADQVMTDLLKKVAQKGVGLEIADRAGFQPGAAIFTTALVVDTPIQAQNVRIQCGETSSGICGSSSDSPIEVRTEGQVRVNSQADAFIAACKGPARLEYHICIGSRDLRQEVTDTCVSACGLAG